MATISTTIKLKDEMSGKLKGIGQQAEQAKNKISAMGVAGGMFLSQIAMRGIGMISNAISESQKLYQIQMENEVKLATVTKQRMGLNEQEIQSLYDLAAANQKLGVIGDEVQLAGMQQVATFAKQKSTVETLLPAMNNLIAQQNGYNATSQDAVGIANLLGKALESGSTAMLRRVGITATEAEAQLLKFGNEEERAAILAQIVNNNVGNMNESLLNTDAGKLKQVSMQIGDIKENIGKVITAIKSSFASIGVVIANKIGNAVSFIEKNIEKIKLALTIASIAVVGFATVWAISWAIANWPILAVIAGITLLISFMSKLGITSNTILEIITRSFMIMFSTIWNGIAIIYNIVASFAEFLINVWIEPEYSFKNLINNMIDAVFGFVIGATSGFDSVATNLANAFISGANLAIGAINKIISALNKIPGVNIGEIGQFQAATSVTSNIEDLRNKMKFDVGAKPEGYKSIAKMDYKSIGGASGLSFGGGMSDKIATGLGGITDMLEDTNELLDGQGSLKSAGDVQIKDDNLKWLLDIATIKSAAEYRQSPINVTMNTGDINNGTDEKTLLRKFENIIVNAVNNNLAVT